MAQKMYNFRAKDVHLSLESCTSFEWFKPINLNKPLLLPKIAFEIIENNAHYRHGLAAVNIYTEGKKQNGVFSNPS